MLSAEDLFRMATTGKREGTDLRRDAQEASPEDVTFHTSRRIGAAVSGGLRDRTWVLFFVIGLVSGALTTVAAQHAMPVAVTVPEPVVVASEADYEADVAALATNSRTVRERIFRIVNSVEIEIGAAREEIETAVLAGPGNQ
jgi:hypothetical protein